MFFTGIISDHIKKNRRFPTSSYFEWQEKKLQIKVVQNWISYKNVHERICPSPYGAELGASKDWYGCYMVLKLQIAFNLCLLPKICITSKKASHKSCSELNFVQKSPRVHMSISPQSGARALERLIWLLYYTILKLQTTFNLGLLPKICITSRKASNKSCSKLNFVQKVRKKLRVDFSISVWSISWNPISENRKKLDFFRPDLIAYWKINWNSTSLPDCLPPPPANQETTKP